MSKEIYDSKDIYDKILEGVDTLTNPIRQTLSPLGGNVMFEDEIGISHVTNDGYTIAKHTQVEEPIANQTIQAIKGSSMKTNTEAGDGTSSTIVLSSVLIKEGIKLLKNGWNQIDIRNHYKEFGQKLKDEINKSVRQINGDKDLLYIANVSSSNDDEIASNTVKTIKIAGKDGQVMIHQGFSNKTELIEDTGFIIQSGMVVQELSQNKSFSAKYEDVPVFITDKRLYYESEAEKILSVILQNGYRSVVIVASDFIGEALPYFVENHQKGIINILLVKESKPEILSDLSVYLGGEVVSDKSGALDDLTIDGFTMAKMVFCNPVKTIISRDKKEKNKQLEERVTELKNELKKDGDKLSGNYQSLEKRIASLTNGMVTIKVGGNTVQEITEKIFKYEDAVNATRASLDGGYVIGGGIAMYNAWKNIDTSKMDKELVRVFDKYCKTIFSQISENCGVNPEVNMYKLEEAQKKGSNFGFNAMKRGMSDLLKDGVIEPHKVITQVIDNSISVAGSILTSRYRIINKIEKKDK